MFSGQQQDQGFDDKNRLSFPFPALALPPELCWRKLISRAEPTRGLQLDPDPQGRRTNSRDRRGTGRKGKQSHYFPGQNRVAALSYMAGYSNFNQSHRATADIQGITH